MEFDNFKVLKDRFIKEEVRLYIKNREEGFKLGEVTIVIILKV